jgi:hypothetical protein
MATAAQVIKRAIEVGIFPADATYAATYLRDAEGDLWPKGKRGGWRNAPSLQPHHAVNYVLALLSAPLMRAGELVPSYRLFVPTRIDEWTEDADPLSGGTRSKTTRRRMLHGSPLLGIPALDPDDAILDVIPGRTLAETLEYLLRLAATKEWRSFLLNDPVFLLGNPVEIAMQHGESPSASIRIRWSDGRTQSKSFSPERQQSDPAPDLRALIPIHGRSTWISGAIFAHLADVLGDTLLQPSSGAPPAEAPAGNETGPAVDAAEPIPSDEKTETEPRGATPEATSM